MNKRIIILLMFSGFAFGQATNPCEDGRYLEIKKKTLEEMTDREYTYFIQKDKECAEYKPSKLNKSEVTKSTIVKKHEEPFQQEDILSGLDEEQRKFYMKNKLNIELKAKTTGGAYGGSSIVSYSGETSTKWEAYKGFDKISEEQFFQLTGYTDEAKLAQAYHSNSKNMGWGGCITGILGLLFFSAGEAAYNEAIELDYTYDENYNVIPGSEREKLVEKSDRLHGQGAFFMLGGTILSVYGFMRLEQNWTAYSTVHGIANEYNNKLLQEISNK